MIAITHPIFIASLVERPPTQQQTERGQEIAQGLRAIHQISTDPTRAIYCPLHSIKQVIILDLGARSIASDLCSRVGLVAQRSFQQLHDAFSLLEMIRVARPIVFLDPRIHYQTNYQFLKEIFGQPSTLNESGDFVPILQTLLYKNLPPLS